MTSLAGGVLNELAVLLSGIQEGVDDAEIGVVNRTGTSGEMIES